jgi:hypothetical protein
MSKVTPLPWLLALLAVVAGCADTNPEDEAVLSEEDVVRGAGETLESYDASDDELAAAADASSAPHELTLYAIPAPRPAGLSWRSPGALARRTLINNGLGLSRSLGHAGVRVACAATGARSAGHFQGSVYDTGTEFREMVLGEKAGLGVLFRTVAGALETEEALEETLQERYRNGRVSFIRFTVSPETCHALLDYAAAFEAADVAKRYGFVRPLHREGAGCSAFSMAFLALANLEEERFRQFWTFDVRVPMSLVGGRENPGNAVHVAKLFFTTRPWATEDEPHRRLVGWDPTMMFTAIRAWSRSALRDRSAVVERRGRALGLVLDRQHVAPRRELTDRTYWAGEPGAPRAYWSFGDP